MAEPRRRRRPRREADADHDLPKPVEPSDTRSAESDTTERELGRFAAFGIPSVGAVAALIAGAVGGLGPAVLVLAGAALLGTIAFFWASLRTLSGDAPLPEGIVANATWSRAAPPEKKREVLRALKDLELEHAMGKIDDADYLELSTRYRETAKAILRRMDADLSPRRERAEKLVAAYLQKRGLGASATITTPARTTSETAGSASDAVATQQSSDLASDARVGCASCGASNELDALFCKKCGASVTRPDEKKADATV